MLGANQHFPTSSDNFRQFPTFSDNFRHFPTFSDVFRQFPTFSDIFRHIRNADFCEKCRPSLWGGPPISREPEFSRICGFRQKLCIHNTFNFRFFTKFKLIFWTFLGHFRKNGWFFHKLGSVVFCFYWTLTSYKKPKELPSQFWEKCVTDVWRREKILVDNHNCPILVWSPLIPGNPGKLFSTSCSQGNRNH